MRFICCKMSDKTVHGILLPVFVIDLHSVAGFFLIILKNDYFCILKKNDNFFIEVLTDLVCHEFIYNGISYSRFYHLYIFAPSLKFSFLFLRNLVNLLFIC